MLRVYNFLYGVSFFPFDQFRDRSGEVGAMHYCFFVWCEKICMEHWVDAPLCGKFKLIVDCGHHLSNFKRAMPSWHKLGGWLIETEILAF
jgi:hypothetical protein